MVNRPAVSTAGLVFCLSQLLLYIHVNQKLKHMTVKEVKEQLQEDVLVILEGFGIDEAMEGGDYNNMVSALCDTIINNINKLNVDGHN